MNNLTVEKSAPKSQATDFCLESSTIEKHSLPSCIEIGLEASKRGDYKLARQMFRTSMHHVDEQDDNQIRAIELTTYIAETHLKEGNYELAEGWYLKALQLSDFDQRKSSLQSVFILAKLAKLQILNSNMTEFEKYMEQMERAYLLLDQKDLSGLLHVLMDTSWSLCQTGRLEYLRPINEIITQIMTMNEEDEARALA